MKRVNSCLLEASGQLQAEGFEADGFSENKDSLSKPSIFSFGLDCAQPVEQFRSMLEEQAGLTASASKQVRSPVRRSQSEIWRDEQLLFTRITSDQTIATRHSRNLSLGEHPSSQRLPGLEAVGSSLEDLVPGCSSLSLTKALAFCNLEEIESIFERESCGSETPKWALVQPRRLEDLEDQHILGCFSAALEDLGRQSQVQVPFQHSNTSIVEAPQSSLEIDLTASRPLALPVIDSEPPAAPLRVGRILDRVSEESGDEGTLGSPAVQLRPCNKPPRSFLFVRPDLPRSRCCRLDPAGEILAADKASTHSHATAASADKKAGSNVGTPSTRHSLVLDNKPAPKSPSPPQSCRDARIILTLALFALFLLLCELA